jgi:hypothetical protein
MSMKPNGIRDQENDDGVREKFPHAGFVQRASAEIRKRPILAAAGAGAIGMALGGVVLSGWGRLAFVGVVGYFASELWRREGHIDIDHLVASLSNDLGQPTAR